IRPATRWEDVLPKRQRRHNWRLLHEATGTPHWPRLTALGRVPDIVATVSGTARYLVAHSEAVFHLPTEGWSHSAIAAKITQIMREQLQISDFRWDQEFVRDLGVD